MRRFVRQTREPSQHYHHLTAAGLVLLVWEPLKAYCTPAILQRGIPPTFSAAAMTSELEALH